MPRCRGGGLLVLDLWGNSGSGCHAVGVVAFWFWIYGVGYFVSSTMDSRVKRDL